MTYQLLSSKIRDYFPEIDDLECRCDFCCRKPYQIIHASNFIKECSHSDAIDAAVESAIVSFKENGVGVSIILDKQDWILDRAILLPSHIELIIDGCILKLADRVFDNIIRVAGIQPDPSNPFGFCRVDPTKNIRIIGRNNAVIEGADIPYEGINPKTGKVTSWVGDYYGWRTVGILLSKTNGYEISGFTMRKTHCWAISQDQCSYGYLHDIIFETSVKNGDGVDFRNGCSYCVVDTISGSTSDDTIACTALNGTYFTSESNYIFPMQPSGLDFSGELADIHDIVIKNIFTSGNHHTVICLATSPRVYNISIENVIENAPSTRQACVKIYSGYGTGYQVGNLCNISVKNVVSKGARYAVMVKAAVKDICFKNIKQMKKGSSSHYFQGKSENLTITDITTTPSIFQKMKKKLRIFK